MGVGGIRVVNVAILFIIRGSRLREFAGSEEHLRLDKLQVTSDIQDHDHTSAFFSYGCICRCCPLESGLLGHLEWYVEGSCAFASWFQLLLPDATFGTPDVSSPQQLLMLFATSNSPCFRPLELIYIVEKIGLALIRVGARVTGQVFKNESRRLAGKPNEHHAQLAFYNLLYMWNRIVRRYGIFCCQFLVREKTLWTPTQVTSLQL